MFHLEVAVPTPLSRTFTYLCAARVPAGSRVLVPFGRRLVVGVVLGEASPLPELVLKHVEKVIDESPIYSAHALEIARWISVYYIHPLGEVLRTMLPASATKTVKASYVLTEAGAQVRLAAAAGDGLLLGRLFGKTRLELAAATLTTKLAKDGAGRSPAEALKALTKAGLISPARGASMRPRRDLGGSGGKNGKAEPVPPEILTDEQARAFRAIVDVGLGAPQGGKVFLLHGVTGSGKTEVYLQLIEETLRRSGGSAQALVLVPEISLTPQMTRIFERRFPGAVAVVHSAMTDADRWAELSRIRAGAASVLIGPRSAVFGPFLALQLILVDEEHDGSYKQSTGLTYNGRDVAVLRGRLEGATVVLGSATPSMESYNNALTGRYTLLELASRVRGRPLPTIEVIAGERQAGRRGTLVGPRDARHVAPARAGGGAAGAGDEGSDELPIDARIIEALRANHAAGRQAIVLVNRRGYAYYLFHVEEKKAIQCPHCSISMTLHARSTVLRCHYCDHQAQVSAVVRERPGATLVAVGYGSQRAEDGLIQRLPGARIVRLDSDTVVQRDVLPRVLGDFRDGAIDILVGTQILAKGHDFPNVTLIVILEVDQLLGLPDFRAGERTFQLVVQAAGRAGRAELPGRVLIQTMRAGHPVVTSALQQDFKGFAERELKFRRAHAYPPFARMIALDFSSTDKSRLVELCGRIERWLASVAVAKPQLVGMVRVLGPGVPPIETIRSRHRRTLIFASDQNALLRALVDNFLQEFQKLPGDLRMRIDVDPQSLS